MSTNQHASTPSAEFARSCWLRANKEHLGETSTALLQIPEAFRGLVLAHLDADLEFDFITPLQRLHEEKGSLSAIQVGTVLNSAKLKALSAAGYLGFMPWHVVDRIPNLKAELSEILHERLDFMGVQQAFVHNGAMNLFIAAKPADDRESYLRAAKALTARLPAARVVFDAEIISYWPEHDFKAALAAVGVAGHLAGISTRADAASHSCMNAAGMNAIYIDTDGRQFNPRSSVPPANDRAAAQQAAEAPATAPSERTGSRLEAIKARQAAMRKAA